MCTWYQVLRGTCVGTFPAILAGALPEMEIVMTGQNSTPPSIGKQKALINTRHWTLLLLVIAIFGNLAWLSGVESPFNSDRSVEAQSAPKWKQQVAGVIPTDFGELISVNGTAGNYSLVFRDSEKVLRIVDLRGGKIPNRSLVIQRK